MVAHATMLTIAYLGPEHTNTHLAAQRRFGTRSRYAHEPTVDDVFSAVERRRADYGVVPVENSLEGAVTHTLDRFIDFKDSPVRIAGEIEFPIRHYLVRPPAATLSSIQAVYSHPQALAQCRRWLRAHLAHKIVLLETNSTAEAVDAVLSHGRLHPTSPLKHVAAIGREEAARGRHLAAVPIADDRENKTRFLILSLRQPRRGRRHKTSLLFALKDRPGALSDALTPFKRERINLTKIESRPSKKKAWEYDFFIDFAGHESEPQVKRALRALQQSTLYLRVLGSYPTAKA